MKKIAIYGKGGIGKSTTSANLSAALSQLGWKVMQIGCDPKADSTMNLLHGFPPSPVMNALRDESSVLTLESIVKEGFGGVKCIETGGPAPGIGCAGRGIIATFNVLEDLHVFETFKPDVVIYDVLGDVVCGGFAAPIREGYAEDVYIVTSGEKMALFAANNIYQAVQNFADRGYAHVRGVIMNRRNIENEEEKVRAFAESIGVPVIGDVPRSQAIQDWEDKGMTVIEGDPTLPISQTYFDIARRIMGDAQAPGDAEAVQRERV